MSELVRVSVRGAWLAGAIMAIVAGCTFDGLDAYTAGSDAAGPDGGDAAPADAVADQGPITDAIVDVPVDAPPPCNLSAPFANAAPVTSLNTTKLESQAELSPDLLTVYFESDRLNAGSNVFTASRATPTAAFGAVSPVTSLNFATADTWNVTLTGDGLTAYLVTDQGGADHMYVAKRSSSLAAFGSPTLMPSPIVSGQQPFVRVDGQVLYYSAPNGTISRAVLGNTPTVTTVGVSVAQHLIGIPVVDPTETVLYFAAYVSGNGDSFDIYMASRATANDAWSAPAAVTELNGPGLDAPSWISADKCTLYYTKSPPNDAGGDWNIYSARRP